MGSTSVGLVSVLRTVGVKVFEDHPVDDELAVHGIGAALKDHAVADLHGRHDVGELPVTADGKVRPEDLIATIFHCLGYEPGFEYRDPLNRPFPISRGEVIRGILA